MGDAVELVGGLPTIEASVINFARILEERIFISYLRFIFLFIVNVEESQSINPAVEKGKGKKCKKKGARVARAKRDCPGSAPQVEKRRGLSCYFPLLAHTEVTEIFAFFFVFAFDI